MRPLRPAQQHHQYDFHLASLNPIRVYLLNQSELTQALSDPLSLGIKSRRIYSTSMHNDQMRHRQTAHYLSIVEITLAGGNRNLPLG